MTIDFRNVNTLWASILVETLHRLGLTTAVICPGSRSTPLTIAFANHSNIEAIPILDERSASFFALGIAKKSGLPVVLVCTSGTAGANFYPAVIEAKESHVPLLILTADRPPELRHCHAGQTIDQVKLYGNYPNWQTEIAVPSAEEGMINYLRQTLIYAWERSLFPARGVVHLNLPFREPLAPIPNSDTEKIQFNFDVENFFTEINLLNFPSSNRIEKYEKIIPKWQLFQRGIIIAGVDHSYNPQEYCRAIARLSEFLKYPVLGEALSPVRNYAALNPYLISTYDLILRNSSLAENLKPDIVIQIGELPTSKELRTWLDITQPPRWIIDNKGENLDALHGKTIHLRTSIEQLANSLSFKETISNSPYLKLWCDTEKKVRKTIDQTLESIDSLLEGKIAWLLSQTLPENTPIFIANSMSVRNAEFFWQPNNFKYIPYFNRGANGIDGTLSTALGIAHHHQSSVMLTGDLALLHDNNGFLINKKFRGHLTIILVNNDGGGIFEMLPIAQFDPYFEDFFATPQTVNFGKLCLAYGIDHYLIQDWQQLKQLLNPLPETGIRVLELNTNRKLDAEWLKTNLSKFSLT
ncbi:2-succinyl-6-hydroxy-2,4-cyclohexadiene-1-carboxylic acid synthase/2-oxoglutarate decarboxylase [Gloeothece citriformis PCC 7424]|uniref:2-succinyl-5-enolpyruvyl-6-hydroxy-3-cyclohexene-1-carboxylate synthase n=1 Tax=Gloeothece citriformis (strain PCC 7424) TaxID=65393 RepID=MEND_GLOC7|nr:2-succinyl-5-enolpyruvyl-6-hydroxy-3-cyclohexene-1-carboxylic-acid synthase [Gloeothece citriformis]B7K8M6.1 RecName: Full=2-succinyl-5-enolpyruvyl-6-hydroxy-3-cyclohexene-1-carboxylate synthase; Short=SEPHCHC synthase [Gloeothece citriformis PCC 7424]ACK71224.1 2-succinyl-6-hydroxy-2,4-cyclohexadiene-1-carboxylic acid synthase/2-oxoglutarate decarboxylase [Gloeothece citriformis PCC 7424]